MIGLLEAVSVSVGEVVVLISVVVGHIVNALYSRSRIATINERLELQRDMTQRFEKLCGATEKDRDRFRDMVRDLKVEVGVLQGQLAEQQSDNEAEASDPPSMAYLKPIMVKILRRVNELESLELDMSDTCDNMRKATWEFQSDDPQGRGDIGFDKGPRIRFGDD